MIENEAAAAKVSKSLQDAFEILGQSIVTVNECCEKSEAELYRRKIGDIFYIIVFGLLEPLYKTHPQLKPSDWED